MNIFYFYIIQSFFVFQLFERKNKSTTAPNTVECCYDIILSKQHSVSESPGYEKIVKQFGRRQE